MSGKTTPTKATLSRPCVLTSVVGMSTAAAAKSVIAWNGVSFMLPLVSAVLADSAHWDRYCTIAASSLLYVLVTPSSS